MGCLTKKWMRTLLKSSRRRNLNIKVGLGRKGQNHNLGLQVSNDLHILTTLIMNDALEISIIQEGADPGGIGDTRYYFACIKREMTLIRVAAVAI